ncbi:MAG: hypothetical protein M3457_11540 [Chloroflexota bacterium]|nr:hypothetical protein [Chloroflexota bacterium]
MTDRDVEREIEANKQRAVEVENEANDDGPIVDTLENVVAPFTRGMVNDGDDEEDDVARRRKDNDAAQQPE